MTLPIYFEPDGEFFVVRGLKAGARLEAGGVLRLSHPQVRSLSLSFAEGDRRVRPEAIDLLPGRSHYFSGRNPRNWRTGVPHFGRVRFRNVYPGIDVVYYGASGALEYDIVVAPGADSSRIRLSVTGARTLISDAGDLMIEAGGQRLLHARPHIYQRTEAGQAEVGGRYRIDRRGAVRIDLDRYDSRRPLVIDPTVVYSTLLGGDDVDEISGMAVDAPGNVYVTGSTGSVDFPGSTAANSKDRTRYRRDAWVVKLNPAGTAVLFTAIIGSPTGDDRAVGVAVGPTGDVYVAGSTSSPDFPVTPNAAQPRPTSLPDAFVLKLDPSGSRLLYSTLFGGGRLEFPQAVAIDAAGQAVVAGYTNSLDFPRISSIASVSGDPFKAFVYRVDTTTGRLVYSSVFGGSGGDEANAVALDAAGNCYVTGTTRSSDFPVSANAYQRVFKGSVNAFVSKLSPAGNSLVYSTFLGGGSPGTTTNAGNAIAVDGTGNAYVAGTTNSLDFPVTSLLMSERAEVSTDAFLVKLNPSGSAPVYSSLLGGRGFDYGFGVALAAGGEAWISGVAQDVSPSNFPVVDPTQRAWGGGYSDWFLSRVNAAGTALASSTFVGGLGEEGGLQSPRRGGVATDASGNVYLAGHTASADFPTTLEAYQPRYGGHATAAENFGEGFIVKIDPSRDPSQTAVTPQDRVITTVIGGGAAGGATSGPATQAAIGEITAMTLSPSGDVVFASMACGAPTIIGGNIVPGPCWSGPIRAAGPDGFLRVVAGAGTGGIGSGDGGPATQAVLDTTTSLAADTAGNIYIAEAHGNFAHNRVWKVDTNGIIRRFAGTGAFEYCPACGDGGPARDAKLAYPAGLAVDRLGNVYISDAFNGRIRKVAPDGIITTFAGGGTAELASSDGIPATQARLGRPSGITVDASGNVYFLEKPFSVGQTVRKVTPEGVITTIAGSQDFGFNGDARPARGARLSASANGIALAPNGEIYIADTGNNRIRRIDRNGMIWNVAGTLAAGSSGDNGPGGLAQLERPLAIAFDAEGNLCIAEARRVRKLAAPRPLPRFEAAGVVSAAGYRTPAVVARGSVFSVFGAGVGPQTGRAAPGYPLGEWLADVRVRVTQGGDNRYALPLYVSAGQINAIMPSGAPLGNAQLQTLYAGYPSALAPIRIVPVNFQFFLSDERNAGLFQMVVSASDYRLCTRDAPASPGQTVIGWGTGLGAIAEPDGLPPVGGDLPVDVEVLVGGVPAQVTYRGRAPGFSAVDNIYFVIPADAPEGCQVPVLVRAGGMQSEAVFLAVGKSGPCE